MSLVTSLDLRLVNEMKRYKYEGKHIKFGWTLEIDTGISWYCGFKFGRILYEGSHGLELVKR